MTLETMEPDPIFDEEAHSDTVETLAEYDDLRYIVWGGDWCGDCRAQLPTFGAALQAAGVGDDRVEEIPVEKIENGSKAGPKVEEYGIEYIPTVVVEHVSRGETDGEEIARFVEQEPVSIPVYLAEKIRDYFREK
ncbi:MAG: TlpA family protein disulfide reductase, partial [Halapricum sp.]